jgi:F0F1-type ATP synthase assembly protein I
VVTKLKNRLIFLTLANVVIAGLVIMLKWINSDLFSVFSINSSLLAFPYFSFGYIIKNKNTFAFNLQGIKGLILKILIILSSIIILALIVKYNGQVNIAAFIYGENIIDLFNNI